MADIVQKINLITDKVKLINIVKYESQMDQMCEIQYLIDLSIQLW